MKINFQHKLLPIDKICLSVVTTVMGLGILGISNGHAHANTTTVNKSQPTTSKTKTSSAQVKQPVKRQITVQPKNVITKQSKNIKKVSSKQPVASVKKVKQPATPVKPLTTKTTPKQTKGKVSKTYTKPVTQRGAITKAATKSKPVLKSTTPVKTNTTKITPKQKTGKVSKTYVKPALQKTTTKKTTNTSKSVQKPTTTHSNVTKSPTSKKINAPTTKAKPVTIKTPPKQTMGKVSKKYTKPVPQKATTKATNTSEPVQKLATSVKITTPKTTTSTNSTLKSTSLDESKTIASPPKSIKPINKLNVVNESNEVPNIVADNIVATTEPMSEIKAATPQLDSGVKDYYKSMTQLFNETTEGVDWKKDTRNNGSSVLIVAPHGGGIEQGSSELTKLIANQGNYDFFSFEGIRPSNNAQLHVTSTHYDDPTLSNMIENRKAIISIHGAAGNDEIVYLGGLKSALRDEIQQQLEQRGFKVEVPPTYLGGAASKNFINTKANNMGIQIELTNALRKKLFQNGNMNSSARKNVNNWTSTMYDFSTALNNAIQATV